MTEMRRKALRLQRALLGIMMLLGCSVAPARVSGNTMGRARLTNHHEFPTSEVVAYDYMKLGLCPKNTQFKACSACYESGTCATSMFGFEMRVGRVDTTVPYAPTTATTSLVAGFVGAPAFIVSFVISVSFAVHFVRFNWIYP